MDDLNATRVESANVYAHCHARAAYLDRRHELEAVCEHCAPCDSDRDVALVLAGANVLRTSVEMLRYAGLDHEEAAAMMIAMFEDRDDSKLTDLGPVGLPAWARGNFFEDDTRFVPLEGGER